MRELNSAETSIAIMAMKDLITEVGAVAAAMAPLYCLGNNEMMDEMVEASIEAVTEEEWYEARFGMVDAVSGSGEAELSDLLSLAAVEAGTDKRRNQAINEGIAAYSDVMAKKAISEITGEEFEAAIDKAIEAAI